MLGPPRITSSNELYVCKEFRGLTVPQLDYDAGGLAEISFASEVGDLVLGQIGFFKLPVKLFLAKLLEESSDWVETLGILVSIRLGISLTGFHQESDLKGVNAFRKGVWDAHLSESRPFLQSRR